MRQVLTLDGGSSGELGEFAMPFKASAWNGVFLTSPIFTPLVRELYHTIRDTDCMILHLGV